MALAQNTLLPIAAKTAQNGQTAFGLHPSVPELASLFTAGQLAFLANVGTLSQPVTRAHVSGSQLLPCRPIFSLMPTSSNSGRPFNWMDFTRADGQGRMADSVEPRIQYELRVSADHFGGGFGNFHHRSNDQALRNDSRHDAGPCGLWQPGTGLGTLQQLLTFDTGVSLIQATSAITSSSLADSKILSGALNPAPTITTPFPTTGGPTGLAAQLKQVAQIIAVRSALGLSRQVFFCSLGGFDTHSNQIALQGPLLQQLSQAVSAFYSATVELNVASQVTTFTMSDFSRTFQPASNGGSDHAWGSVQLIVGGAVKGADIYGTMPDFKLGSASVDDAGSNGRWIPTTSTDQYGATLAQWFGVSAANLPPIFPNLANFTTQKLGFI